MKAAGVRYRWVHKPCVQCTAHLCRGLCYTSLSVIAAATGGPSFVLELLAHSMADGMRMQCPALTTVLSAGQSWPSRSGVLKMELAGRSYNHVTSRFVLPVV